MASNEESNSKKADRPRYNCEYCCYWSREPGNLEMHMTSHTPDKPFFCSICKVGFPAQYQLSRHNVRHQEPVERRPLHKCDSCGVGFLTANALYYHRSVHLSDKKYKCTKCDKSFAQASEFAQHMRVHRQQLEREAEARRAMVLNKTANEPKPADAENTEQ